MKKQLFWFLWVVIGSSLLLTLLIDDDKPQTMAVETELQPDFIAYQLIRTSFDASGNMSGMIRATQMSHFELLGQIQLEEPAFTIFEQQLPKWQVSSTSGVLYPDDKVVLEQNVLLENLKSGELFNKVESEQLEYVFDQQIISTNQQVVIFGDGFAINGQGVKVNLVTQKLQLQQHKGTVYRHDE